MRKLRLVMWSCLLLLGDAGRGAAQPAAVSSAQHIEKAQEAFKHGQYKLAMDHYLSAFALESSAQNAVRVFIASTYAEDPPLAVERLKIWLQKKRQDARGKGDTDESWSKLDDAIGALGSAAKRREAKIQEQQAEIARLRTKETESTIIVRRLMSERENMELLIKRAQEERDLARVGKERLERELSGLKTRLDGAMKDKSHE